MLNLLKKISRLEIIVFVSGAVVMVLELIGSRILAPNLGTSIFVWTALIGIILGALSVGYCLGGSLSKKNPKLSVLAAIILVAGVLILSITVLKEPVLKLALPLGVKAGSVVATLMLFTLPSIVMGMVSPYAIRLKVQTVEGSGSAAGILYAISTMGSIFGTFLAGFYLIPTFSSTQILLGLGAVMALTALIGGLRLQPLAVLVIVGILGIGTSLVPSQYVYESDSAYNHIRVLDTILTETGARVRVLLLATEAHSILNLDSNDLIAQYHQLYQLDNLFAPKIQRALTLGAGAYIAPQNFLERYPTAEMTVVEIDPAVTEVARQYFNLAETNRLTTVHQDARLFLNDVKEKYEIIYGDAFASYYSIPFQLTTVEALRRVSDALTDDGVFVLNVISGLEGETALFFSAEYKTLAQIFPQLYVFPTRFYRPDQNLQTPQNIVIFATKNSERVTLESLLKLGDEAQREQITKLIDPTALKLPDVGLLTDEFAPVDYYVSKLL